ncbi:TetR/AcrR family transcriptional regulator [Actinotalea sp. K2]|uniref:TetR/AcrR family transcriptional regulator n=1 Tax=Actinotalea sp. K2 TaxID=2939438 RepID=UPI0020172D9A|nr:TetR/AcrR family transcriptional regulator [Actinotalea sp. K2]MCL3861775.1 TetR/AcrR family transcriptional regulator [Actinotalea sp. K2]
MIDRRSQILRAAHEIATTDGLSGVSVRHVAARAGIGASTLRHYFPTQQDLFDAVLGTMLDAQLSDLRIKDATVAPAIRLTECVAQLLPATDADVVRLEGWLAGYAAAIGPTRTEQQRAVLAALSRRARDRVGGWLAVLDAEDALRSPDLDQAAIILLAMVDGLALGLITPEGGATLERAREALARVVEAAVVAPHSPG